MPSFAHSSREEAMRDLHEHAAAVARLRVGAHRAAMVEVEQDLQAHLDDGVRLAVLHVGDEADAAGIVLVGGVVEPLGLRKARIPHHGRAGGDVAQSLGGLRRSAGALVALRGVCVPCTLAHCRLVRSPGSAFAAVIRAGFHLRAFSVLPASGKPIAPAGALCPEPVSFVEVRSRSVLRPLLAGASGLSTGDAPVRPAFCERHVYDRARPVASAASQLCSCRSCSMRSSEIVGHARQLGQHDCPNVPGHCQILEGHTSGQNRLSCKIVEACCLRRATNGKSSCHRGSRPDLGECRRA